MRFKKISLALSILLFSGASFAEIKENNTQDTRAKEALYESNKVKDRLEDIRNGDVSALEQQKSEDVRMRAMKEAATSVGIQEGYIYQVGQLKSIIEGQSSFYDLAFDFSALMRAGGKIANEQYVIPPVIEETRNNMAQKEDGSQMVLSGTVYVIKSNVRLSSAPPHWRQYIFPDEATTTLAPPKDLLPQNSDEKDLWKDWVDEGFRTGLEMGDIEMRDRIAKLKSDFIGMARYMRLVESGQVKEPTVAIQHIDVQGDENTMKLRSSIYTITDNASMVNNPEKWGDGKRKK